MVSYLRRGATTVEFPIPPIVLSQMKTRARRKAVLSVAGTWTVVEFPAVSVQWEVEAIRLPEALASSLRGMIDGGGVVYFNPGDGVERVCVFGEDCLIEPMVAFHPLVTRTGGSIPSSVQWWRARLQLFELVQ